MKGIKLFFIVVSFMFFVGISDVRAKTDNGKLNTGSLPLVGSGNNNPTSCSCYYTGQHNNTSYGKDTVYAVKVRFSARDANDKCVSDKNCTDRNSLHGGTIQGYVVDLCEAWREGDTSSSCVRQDHATIGNPFVDPEIQKTIVNQKCSLAACSTAKLTFWSKNESKEIVSRQETAEFDSNGNRKDYSHDIFSATADLQAITAETYEKLKNAESLVEAAIEEGTIGSVSADIDAIIRWGNPTNVLDSTGALENLDCQSLLSNYNEEKTMRDFLSNLFWIISIIGIILLIIMTSIEFIKVVTGQDDEGLIKAFKHTVIRAICVVILLLLPMILSFILGFMNDITDNEEYYLKDKDGNIVYTTDANGNKEPVKLVHVGANGDPLCSIGSNGEKEN